MRGKTCVITGATSGIGLETAKRLGALGARLILVGRNRDKATAAIARLRAEVPGAAVEVHYADLSRADETATWRQLCSTRPGVLTSWSTMQVRSLPGASLRPKGSRSLSLLTTWATSGSRRFYAKRLIASAPARVVNVASEAHRGSYLDFEDLQSSRHYSGWRAYQRSKLANILFTRELARRLEGTGVTANCLHPGFVATGFGDNNRGFWRLGIAIGKALAAIPVQRGAETPVYLASSPDLYGISGKYFSSCRERQPDVAAQNDETAARLWKESEQFMGL